MDLKMLGARIREIRKAKVPKVSGEMLAELSGLSLVTIYNLEAGKIPDVKLDTIDRIAKALNIPIGILTDDTLTIEATKAQLCLRFFIQQHLQDESLAADSGREPYVSRMIEEAKKKSGTSGKDAQPRSKRTYKRAG